jgi:outer membrane protein OmpA-like peptidoglycan-associated protein
MKAFGFPLNSALIFIALGTLFAQVPSGIRQQPSLSQGTPVVVNVVTRTITAVSYQHRTGATPVDFRGTDLMPAANGKAKVQSQVGSTKIEATFEDMSPASQFGPEYMTYVLWAITPDGRPVNLGEVVLTGGHAKLLAATNLQAFGLIITAEPYFAVTQPSNLVVAENFIRPDTTGKVEEVSASYLVLQRGQYIANRPQYRPIQVNPKGPLQLAEAENAVEIARLAGAEQYAADTFQRAMADLRNAEDSLSRGSRREAETAAREAAEVAEDARIITFRRIQDDQQAAERSAAREREAQVEAQAQRAAEQARLEQQRRQQAEADREAAERAKLAAQKSAESAAEAQAHAEAAQARALQQQQMAQADADRVRAQAEAQRQAAQAEVDRVRAQAQQQSQAAQAEADRARGEAQHAEQLRQQSEAEKVQLRERLRQQLNVILETRETARGLVVNLSDVLFDTGQYTLKPGSREKMAKLSGVLLAYPGLKLEVEGHTDNVGGDEYNERLSQQRAETVREYLLAQGVPGSSVTAIGLGKAGAVASNDTAAGRQQNRRVEIVVSGEPIGTGDSDVR